MSMINCDVCNNLINTDWHEGEFDIEDRDGDYHDFVCEDCFCNCDEFIKDDDSDNPMTASQILANQAIDFFNLIKPFKRLKK